MGSPRFNNLSVIFCLALLLSFQLKGQQFKNEEELKKEATRLFEEEEFTKAYSLYSQLVSNYPKDPEYNYRLGVCMLYSEPDKNKCFNYLKLAANHPQDAPKDAKFYLAKAYHINYKFDLAIKLYNEYKSIGTASQIKKLQVDREIMACNNGKRLLSSMLELVVLNKKQLNEADYFRSYDMASAGGKLLVKPELFKTPLDKKKKDKSIICMPKNSDRVYFSSYGDNGSNGRDIYYVRKQQNGEFGPPMRVIGINTEFDEDYPFMHPDGKTLYFSSKGFNSMGGYDIFKSVYNAETNSWSIPVNLEFPINSPDDDYLFVTDSAEKIAYFSTGRQSPPGKIDVLKVKTERVPMEIAIIKGTVLKENADQKLNSKITVKNLDNGQIVGVFNAQENGDYYMEVPNGGKFIFTVETPGLPTQSDKVALPMASSLKPFKQSISYDNKVLKILNYFDSPPDDFSYLQYMELIEKKAKLNVNEGELKTPTIIHEEPGASSTKTNTTSAVATNNPTIISEENGTSNPGTTQNTSPKNNETNNSKGMTNSQLVDIAKKDAEEAKTEAKKMNQDALDAFEIAEQKKIEADKLNKEAENISAGMTAITDDAKKKEAEEKVIQLKNDAENASETATTILNLAKNLESDAQSKQKEAEINEQYASELEKASKSTNNKEAFAKLNELQKQVEEISSQKKKSDEVYNSIKQDSEKNQSQITSLEEKSSQLKKEIDEIQKEITLNETEIKNSKDKSLKTNLTNQNKELGTDLNTKTTALNQNEAQLNKLKSDAKSLQNQIDIANTIKTTDSPTAIAKNHNASSAGTNASNQTNINSGTLTAVNPNISASNEMNYTNLSSKYENKINALGTTNDKSTLEQTNTILNDYIKELSDLIALDKVDLKSATKPEEKKKINDEIIKLENQKKVNQNKIASNNQKINQSNGAVVSNAGTPPKNVSASTPSVDLNFNGTNDAGKLDNLKDYIEKNSNPNSSFTNYKESNSQSLKKDADDKMQNVINSQNELNTLIASAKNDIQNNTGKENPDNTKTKLTNDGDALSSKAKEIRTSAQSKTGSEKEQLLSEAKELDKQANQKYIEGADITKTVNSNEYNNNLENINALVKTNKSSKEDLNEAQKLTEEAKTAYKQAVAIRNEANSQGSDAAKLGIISNAEEKEAESINKQKKAVDLLMKANSGFALKTPDNSIPVKNGNNENLNKVTQQFDKLNKDKIEAYMAFSKANQNEAKTIVAQLNQDPSVQNNQEASNFKKDGDKLNNEAQALIGKSLTAPDNNSKQSLLMEANKKEIEAIDNYNKALSSIQTNAVAAKTTTSSATNAANTNTVTNENKTAVNTSSATSSGTVNAVNSNEPKNTSSETAITSSGSSTTTSAPTNTVQETSNVATNSSSITASNNKSSNPGTVTSPSLNDTTIKATLAYFNKNSIELKNNEANTLKNNALTSLIKLADEQQKAETEINASNSSSGQVDAKTNIANLISEAEGYNKQASDIRKEAGTKTGTEKEKLLADAKALDSKANKQKLQAADSQKELNDAQYKLNDEGITALIEKAKTQNATELTQANEILNSIATGKKQANSIREESKSMTSEAAKLGNVSNAEEKELEVLAKQNEVINLLKKYDPNFTAKEASITVAKTVPPGLQQKYDNIIQKEVNELISMNRAFDMEYGSVSSKLPATLSTDQKTLKANADNLMKESKALVAKAVQTSDAKQKKEFLTEAAKKGQESIVNLNKITSGNSLASNSGNTNPNSASNNSSNNSAVTSTTNSGTANAGNDPKNSGPGNSNNSGGNTNVATNSGANNGNANAGTTDPGNNSGGNTNSANNTANNTSGNNSGGNTNSGNNTGNNTSGNNSTRNNAVTIKVKGLEVKNTNAYSASNPIQIDGKIPDGIVFRVQIGAFKTPVANDAFRGLSPVNGESTPNGYIRYTAGNFEKFDDANAVKNDLHNLGYKDAFVVGFYNGKRISLSEIAQLLNKEGKTMDMATSNLSAGITAAANIPKNTSPPVVNDANSNPVVVTNELEKMNGLLYTIQIGVYSKQVSKSQLFNLIPIYTERLPSGLYRYTAGIYNQKPLLLEHRQKVVDIGIRDAFVSAYFNGKKITFTEAERLKTENANLKVEAENPIIFPNGTSLGTTAPSINTPTNTAPATGPTNTEAGNVTPFSNGVTEGPTPTADNGVKVGEEGLTFKVQIGAYRNQVPPESAAKFLNIKTWPVAYKLINGIYIYTVGNFVDAKSAKKLKDELVTLGITDAWVTVYRDGKKLYGTEATELLNK